MNVDLLMSILMCCTQERQDDIRKRTKSANVSSEIKSTMKPITTTHLAVSTTNSNNRKVKRLTCIDIGFNRLNHSNYVSIG